MQVDLSWMNETLYLNFLSFYSFPIGAVQCYFIVNFHQHYQYHYIFLLFSVFFFTFSVVLCFINPYYH
jgi:hypothetical protein